MFTIFFVIDIVNTVIVLLRRKKVFLKLKEDIDELRAQFESDRDLLNEEFERWINDHKELDVVRKRIQNVLRWSMNYVKTYCTCVPGSKTF